MSRFGNPTPTPTTSGAAASAGDRRDTPRLPQDSLVHCDLGLVRDISRTGMRLRCKHLPTHSKVKVHLSGPGIDLTVPAEVMWVQKLGFRKYELGLHFVDISDAIRQSISGLAMLNRDRRTM
jgi:hypothetical protein